MEKSIKNLFLTSRFDPRYFWGFEASDTILETYIPAFKQFHNASKIQTIRETYWYLPREYEVLGIPRSYVPTVIAYVLKWDELYRSHLVKGMY